MDYIHTKYCASVASSSSSCTAIRADRRFPVEPCPPLLQRITIRCAFHAGLWFHNVNTLNIHTQHTGLLFMPRTDMLFHTREARRGGVTRHPSSSNNHWQSRPQCADTLARRLLAAFPTEAAEHMCPAAEESASFFSPKRSVPSEVISGK